MCLTCMHYRCTLFMSDLALFYESIFFVLFGESFFQNPFIDAMKNVFSIICIFAFNEMTYIDVPQYTCLELQTRMERSKKPRAQIGEKIKQMKNTKYILNIDLLILHVCPTPKFKIKIKHIIIHIVILTRFFVV